MLIPRFFHAGSLFPEHSAGNRDRSLTPARYTWNLADLYHDDDEWRSSKRKLVEQIPPLAAFRGTLAVSPEQLLKVLSTIAALSKEYSRLSVYAQLGSDLDTRKAEHLAMVQEMGQVGSDMAAAASFVDPEILEMGKVLVAEFLAGEPRLAIYRHGLEDILRRKEHTGTAGEEKIIADASLMADGPSSIFTIFANADFPYPSITLEAGADVRLDKAGFHLHRQSRSRSDRKAVFSAYLGALAKYERTFGTQLYSAVKTDMFYARARRYPSCLAAALDGNNVPPEVYHRLIENVTTHLDTFHRYLRLRARMLGVDELHYYDLYAPVVPDVDISYSFEEAEVMVLASLAPLGEDYLAAARRAFAGRWFDVCPGDGKVAGAYSNGSAYDVHPYMLLNFNGMYDDVSTLTHELGHTMHSHLANSVQPYPTAHYAIFVAEVASTFNEALLVDHLMKSAVDDRVKLSLLMHYLDEIRGTLYRQTQFAEFELRIHEMAERGETLTGELMSSLYQSITRTYYGHDPGVCVVDDEVRFEWMNVPHFYYTFYVFQYATSLTASAALSERVLAGEADSREQYLDLLRAGGADYPIALLKKAGVDMKRSTPFEMMMKKMNRAMDEIERILSAGNGRTLSR